MSLEVSLKSVVRKSQVCRWDELCEDCGLAADYLVPSSLASFEIVDSAALVLAHSLAAVPR